MLKVAHYGPSGLHLTRREVEDVNWEIVHFIWSIEDRNLPKMVRWASYYIIVFMIFWYSGNQQEFIYFQF